jgi:hypothetical protein
VLDGPATTHGPWERLQVVARQYRKDIEQLRGAVEEKLLELAGGGAGGATVISEEDYRYDEYRVLSVPQEIQGHSLPRSSCSTRLPTSSSGGSASSADMEARR